MFLEISESLFSEDQHTEAFDTPETLDTQMTKCNKLDGLGMNISETTSSLQWFTQPN